MIIPKQKANFFHLDFDPWLQINSVLKRSGFGECLGVLYLFLRVGTFGNGGIGVCLVELMI